MKPKTYPQSEDIKKHKDEIWKAMILTEAGLYKNEEMVENAIRCLKGDARLWVMNNTSFKKDCECLIVR